MLLLQLLKPTGYNVPNFGKLETTRDSKSLNKAPCKDMGRYPVLSVIHYLVLSVPISDNICTNWF